MTEIEDGTVRPGRRSNYCPTRGGHTVSDPGAVYECQDCGERTLDADRCPVCGSTDLERVFDGP